MARTPKLKLVSKDRYRASAAERRRYGGATITEFYVTTPEGKTIVVTGYGKTPGERKTYARKVAEEQLGLVPSSAPQRKPSKKRRYNDSDRMEWYATPANRRRGGLETGDAAVRKTDENNRAYWLPLGKVERNPTAITSTEFTRRARGSRQIRPGAVTSVRELGRLGRRRAPLVVVGYKARGSTRFRLYSVGDNSVRSLGPQFMTYGEASEYGTALLGKPATRNARVARPRQARNPVGALAKKVPPLHPAEIDILRELHQRREAFLKSATEANHRRSNPHPKDLKHPKGTSATPAEIVRGLVARGLVDRHWDGSLGLKLSGAQMKSLREIRNRSGTRSPAERNFFNFDVPNSRLGM